VPPKKKKNLVCLRAIISPQLIHIYKVKMTKISFNNQNSGKQYMDGEEIKGKHKYINLVTKILDEFGTL
jgi:hypothetical protein